MENCDTVGESVSIEKVGDVRVEGLEVTKGFMAPWSNMTLLSLTKRLSEGWEFYAKGLGGWLYKQGEVISFRVKDGLLKPNKSDPDSPVPEQP